MVIIMAAIKKPIVPDTPQPKFQPKYSPDITNPTAMAQRCIGFNTLFKCSAFILAIN